MLRNLFLLVLCLFFVGLYYPGRAPRCELQADYKPVCYYLVSNKVENSERDITVLMDEAHFTEDNLRILMNYFLDKYREPHWMSVFLATHVSQLFDMAAVEGPGKRPSELHPDAGFYRKDGNEFIRYKLPDRELRGIVIKGEDPLHVPQESFSRSARMATDTEGTAQRAPAPVCYSAVFNEVEGKQREVKIFMDEEDFTEGNLRFLMTYFSEKYPKPEWMTVNVYTNIYQLFDHPTIKGPRKEQARLHPSGLLYRKDGNELIRYKLPDRELQTIVVKGRD